MKNIKDGKLIMTTEEVKDLNKMGIYDLNELLVKEFNRKILIINARYKQISDSSGWRSIWKFGALSPELILVDIDNEDKFIFNKLLTYTEVKKWLVNEINKLAITIKEIKNGIKR